MLDQTYSQEFQVQQVVDEKIIDNQTHYLVKWIGYGHEENTWEPLRHMNNAKDKIKTWEKFKLKQLHLIQNYKTLEKLDLQPERNRNSTYTKSAFIEAARKSSTPYRNFKPTILLDTKEKTDNIEVSQQGKIVSVFDRPEVKKITKRKKIERKKKELEIFEQRMKSRPKVWEKYIQNEDQAIKLANEKIKQVVDQVFGSKRDEIQSQPKERISVNQKIQGKLDQEGKQQKNSNEKHQTNNLIKGFKRNEKGKAHQIFSDQEEEKDSISFKHQQKSKLFIKKQMKSHQKKDESSQSMDESTNFMTKKSIPQDIKEIQQETKTSKNTFTHPKSNKHPLSKGQISSKLPIKNKDDPLPWLKEQPQKNMAIPTLRAKKSNFFPKQNLILPETIRLTNSMLQKLEHKGKQTIQTEQSSSLNDLEFGCESKSLFKESSSSSQSHVSNNFFSSKCLIDTKIKNIKQEISQRSAQNSLKPEEFEEQQSRKNYVTDQNDIKNYAHIIQKTKCRKKKKSVPEKALKDKIEGKELQIKFAELINVNDPLQVNKETSKPLFESKVKFDERNASEKASSDFGNVKQQQESMAGQSKSSAGSKSTNKVKLQWSLQIKLADENGHDLKLQTEIQSGVNNEIKNENSETKKNLFIPFECSTSTIEGIQTSDECFEGSGNIIFGKTLSNFARGSNIFQLQGPNRFSQDYQHSTSNRGQRVVNYSSLTNHQSTALPSQDSGQSYHVFTHQNVFNQNFLRNRSLSTMASFNTHKTEAQSGSQRHGPNSQNNEFKKIKNDPLNQIQQRSTPEYLFSSSSQVLDKMNFTDAKDIQKKENTNTLLSLECLLEFLHNKSEKISNFENLKGKNSNLENQQIISKNNMIDLIQVDIDEPQQYQLQNSNITFKSKTVNGSERSSPILINFMEIGSQNKVKASKKTSKKIKPAIIGFETSKKQVKKETQQINPEHNMSEYHQMFILENTFPEQSA